MIIPVRTASGMAGCGCGCGGDCGCSAGMGDFPQVLSGAQTWLSPTTVPAAFSTAISASDWWTLAGLAIVPIGLIMLLGGGRKKFF